MVVGLELPPESELPLECSEAVPFDHQAVDESNLRACGGHDRSVGITAVVFGGYVINVSMCASLHRMYDLPVYA